MTSSWERAYKSPQRKLVRFFEKSRDQWKQKHHAAKRALKRLDNRVRYLEKSKAEWKARARAAEAEVARLRARGAADGEAGSRQKETSVIPGFILDRIIGIEVDTLSRRRG